MIPSTIESPGAVALSPLPDVLREVRAGRPVLVLDDVLSELDPLRCAALLHHLPDGQVVLTTAGVLPEAAHPDAVLRIEAGTVVA